MMASVTILICIVGLALISPPTISFQMAHRHKRYLCQWSVKALQKSPIDIQLHMENNNLTVMLMHGNEIKANQYDRAWEKKFQLLLDYYKTHNHTIVPTSDPTVGRWVQRQRLQYKKGTMSDQRRLLLLAANFVFDVREHNRSNKSKPERDCTKCQKKKLRKFSWEERYDQLKNYFDTYGDSNVPLKQGSLGGWVQYQRRSKKDLSTIQKDKLEQLNFIWNMKDHRWRAKYEELRQFVHQFNHSHVPSTGDLKALQAWCGTQRQLYRRKYSESATQRDVVSALTDERESLLEKIGFDFNKNHEHTWLQRLRQLKEYKRQHGHVNLGKKDGVLGAWADTQRTEYRFRVADHHSHLTDERIEELEALGFAWSIREAQWNENYDNVMRYLTKEDRSSRAKYIRLTPSLAVWLRDQKVLYRAMRRGENNSVSTERAAKLRTLLDEV
mmetsp:Transcript_21006/g.44975  ORF Transcript_21006/g.44975 Transcript_21006/m.44975 type:complete len:442 (+) Transcript_21006:184-1509(+)